MKGEVLDSPADEEASKIIPPPSTGVKYDKKSSFEIHDDIGKKLLDGKFYLSALEFHTELVEVGKELPRLKEFFSNPANFEVQMKLDPFHSFNKTASCLTLDSIDDLARFSDDGLQHETDDKITVLEFELRKAKETIHDLRENITKMSSDREDKEKTLKQSIDLNGFGFDVPINHYEIRTLNFLVNKYLLQRDCKLTSITFAEEVGDQDVDDWEDVGLNTGMFGIVYKL